MNCHLCGHKLKVKTDPKSCDYLLSEGLIKIMAESYESVNTTSKPEKCAFEKLEIKKQDMDRGVLEKPRLESLLQTKSELKYDF